MDNEDIIEFIPDREPTLEELIAMEEDRNEQILQDHRDDYSNELE